MLTEAQAGNITGFSGITINDDGDTGMYFVGQCVQSSFETVAALSSLIIKIDA